MHQFSRPGRRPAGQVIHFTEKNGTAPACGIARDTATINAAADDSEVENLVQKALPGARLFTLAISLSILNKSQPNVKASEKGISLDVIVGEGGRSSTPRSLGTSANVSDYWMPRLRGA
jgi:hypothetical protein